MSRMAQTLDPEQLALTLHEIGAVRLGRFTLHSGRTSPIYLDLRLLVSYPEALRLVTAAYRSKLEDLRFDLLAGTPLAGLPIGTALCLDMNVPLIYPRPTAKSHGTGKQIEGKWDIGQKVAVVDDLITSGDSLLQTIAFLKAAGLQVEDAVVLIDREQGGRETLQAQGYRLHSVVTLRELLAILERKEKITSAERDQVLKALGL
ncbi:MAG: orotate phosphoribosyltransferase [Chloroflexi bacterium]|nr:orotate phosphoribosyltransferase [Chloroflexota bacterium]MCI0578767.1 orotate phosphoribosyltransferase [Chloroflexota bacterium]MCI0648736.1 orotate phosphoribosyltransferase [Chloroflexota bacterium]MCI0731664.1 orotate phosphoribosyltransferase [Chloroflexota bacterium]